MMAIQSAVLSRVSGDMALVNKLRIWIDGDRAPELPAARQVRFRDPATGYTYVAGRFGDEVASGKTVDKGIGSRMLAHANELVVAAYEVERDGAGKALLDESGLPALVLGAAGEPTVVDAASETSLRRYVGLVDAMRQIQIAVGTGPLGGPED
jgi:hypothetical protein